MRSVQIEGLGYSRGLDGFPPLMNGTCFETLGRFRVNARGFGLRTAVKNKQWPMILFGGLQLGEYVKEEYRHRRWRRINNGGLRVTDSFILKKT